MHDPAPPSSGGGVTPDAGLARDASEMVAQRVVALESVLHRDGWSTVTATTTQPEVVVREDPARVGIVHEVACDQATAVVETLQEGAVVASCAYREQADGRLAEVVLLLNPGVEQAILLPAILDRERLEICRSGSDGETPLYTALRHSTAGRLGEVRHPSPGAFRIDPR